MPPAPASGARVRSRGPAEPDVVPFDSGNRAHRAGAREAREAGVFGLPDPAGEAEWRRNMREADEVEQEQATARQAPSGGLTPKQYAGKFGLGAPTLRPPSSASWSDGSGFAMGLILYSLGLCYIRGGWTGRGGVADWFSAKFLNRVRT